MVNDKFKYHEKLKYPKNDKFEHISKTVANYNIIYKNMLFWLFLPFEYYIYN